MPRQELDTLERSISGANDSYSTVVIGRGFNRSGRGQDASHENAVDFGEYELPAVPVAHLSRSKKFRRIARTWIFGRKPKLPDGILENRVSWDTLEGDDLSEQTCSDTKSLRSVDTAVANGEQINTQQNNALEYFAGDRPSLRSSRPRHRTGDI